MSILFSSVGSLCCDHGKANLFIFLIVLRGEMESAMKLLGIKDLSEVHPGLVNTSDVDYLVPSGPNHPYIKWRSRPHL
jgi:L-lactate dehydrogenase (cytochrome)